MKRFFIMFFVVMILTGCETQGRNEAKSNSTFWENFSIGMVVEANAQYLAPGSRPLSGSESGPPEPFTQKHEEMKLQIDPSNVPTFIAAVQSGIDNAITNNGAEIVGRGSGGLIGTSFSTSYRENNIYGVIHIQGIQGEGTTYYLLMTITEGLEKTK